ncbi:hypothetical protein N0B44_28580 [Roseibacterium beibuensis]|uniref:Uncharacterized protein n=1 Tax=[Roseibacterium] beibuensis TaxID=1193142 RepID=A0ABP9LQR9_9RHOB|nr:hypothetical protein [Roseibacterium beibuensis]MCS6626880.1 hypothetical protein [Roseibacterium beibuensis]
MVATTFSRSCAAAPNGKLAAQAATNPKNVLLSIVSQTFSRRTPPEIGARVTAVEMNMRTILTLVKEIANDLQKHFKAPEQEAPAPFYVV